MQPPRGNTAPPAVVVEHLPPTARGDRTFAVTTAGTLYGMQKTTVYLPDALKDDLRRLAATQSTSEAELIRRAIADLVATHRPRRPTLPLFSSGRGGLANRTEELLADGFGR